MSNSNKSQDKNPLPKGEDVIGIIQKTAKAISALIKKKHK
jgi:hypothetical protein